MMYEAIYLRKKPYVIVHNEHQNKFALIASEKKLINFVGKIKKINFEKLLKTLMEKKYINVNKTNFDNLGKVRIKKEIENLL